jgi:hypothetical protein
LAVLTASTPVGRALARWGVGRLPEETNPPAMLNERPTGTTPPGPPTAHQA